MIIGVLVLLGRGKMGDDGCGCLGIMELRMVWPLPSGRAIYNLVFQSSLQCRYIPSI